MTNKNKITVGLFCFLLAVVIPGEAKDPAPLPNIDAASPANNTDRNKAQNCDIKIAPKDALRHPLDGDTLATLHYPDPRSVPDDYSGCLNIWFEADGRSFLTAVIRFKKGQLVSLTDPERNMGCHYDNGRLIKEKSAPAELCPPSGGTVSEWKTDKSTTGGFVRLPTARASDKRSILVQERLVKAEEPTKAGPLPFEKMRAAVYTRDFAQRFALPDPEPGTEPSGGIQAMEFAVEDAKAKYPHKQFATYQCTLKLYLDNKLPIAYPEEGVSGDHRRFIAPMHFFLWPDPDNKHWLKLSEKDRLHFGERQGRYTRSAALATPNYE